MHRTNKGIAHAGGKYIFQADNDDLLMNNALEIFYKVAEASGADVVHTAGYAFFKDNPKKPIPNNKNLFARLNFVDKPSFLPDKFSDRIKIFFGNGVDDLALFPGWLKFIRRDFLVENEITLQEDMESSQDVTWTIKLFYYAKRYLFIPCALYIYRGRADSVSHIDRRGEESLKYRSRLIVKSVKFLCEFFGKEKFFRDNPQCAWMLLDWIAQRCSKFFVNDRYEVPPYDAQKILTEDFAADFGEHAGLIAYLCAAENFSRLKERFYLKKISELERQLKTSTQ